jgi:hypothetical protein
MRSEIFGRVPVHLDACGLVVRQLWQKLAQIVDAFVNKPKSAARERAVPALLRVGGFLQNHHRRALFPRRQRSAQSGITRTHYDHIKVWLLRIGHANLS